ncbi:M1 family peptidase [Gluconobacter sp. R71646]|uniref:Aminopeptidase N n=2 Tax=Acetobacteraceae TaxID=433 RepID=A0ABR9YHB1_9PROT|nr:M1 family peptidase [Gluconobacter sp. R71656]MBF0866663.1 M1 family peptidase [Gluconobacter sp. R75628]MBF0872209.1 M1 family peptidase [Gluconobacter sp. R75629]MBF0881175.1 M1 family peptidase [Gluconobacter potus]
MSLVKPAFSSSIPGSGFEVKKYTLKVKPDIMNGTILGSETILLHMTDNHANSIVFSGNALVIDRATLDGIPVIPVSDADRIVFPMPRTLAKNSPVTIELTYHGRPERGFARSVTTLYTSYFACDWMVCLQDKFSNKAAFSLALQVPAGMQTVSIGKLVSKRAGPEGSEIQSWEAPRPYSSYLYGFAVGQFARTSENVGSAKLTYLSDTVDKIILKRQFAATPEMVRFLSDKAGLPLPVTEYTQLLVSGNEAQEAATYSVIGTDELPKNQNDPAEEWVIVHELTHEWWGNLVTCETLNDFWLNEGITTFMTAAWKEYRYGHAAYDAELAVSQRRWDTVKSEGFDKPLTWSGPYPSLSIRRAIQYNKGAIFMAYLRDTLGDAAFWKGLRNYTRAHAGGTVTSIDLERAMEAASGKNLHNIFAQWVFGKGDNTTRQSIHPETE